MATGGIFIDNIDNFEEETIREIIIFGFTTMHKYTRKNNLSIQKKYYQLEKKYYQLEKK